ncbi:MAG: calcium-binding protein, partial [Alphaproteobacteria bacterium]
AFPDRLRGDIGSNRIDGGAGLDALSGDGGSDIIDGGAGNDLIYGGDGDDRLLGGAGADALTGGAGADRIDGGEGADRLFADLAADVFVVMGLASAGDRVFGFVSGVHGLEIDASGFGGVAGAFAFAADPTPVATSSQQTILYDIDDGRMFFDADGDGAGSRVHVLTLIGAPTLAAADILLG